MAPPMRVPVAAAAVAARGRQRARALCAFGAAVVGVLLVPSSVGEAFVGGPSRPSGRFVVTETLPPGAVCRPAYGDLTETGRPEWNPLPQWRGEKSYHPNAELQADRNRAWYHFDAEAKTLGHLAQAVATILRGKDSPLYDPIRDVGAFAIVTNCEKVRVSGRKYYYKLYFRNLSNRPGHMKVERFCGLQARFPERIIMKAVWGSMRKLPSNRRIFKERLKLFTGPNHLYYHENPIEYPMWKIKTCTHTSNVMKKHRIQNIVTKLEPKGAEALERKKAVIYKQRLTAFKKFLNNQIDKEEPEKAADMSVDELLATAEKDRYSTILKEAGDAPVAAKKIYYYPGTTIPKIKIWKPRGARSAMKMKDIVTKL